MNKRDFELLKSFNILYIEDEVDLLKHTTSFLEDFVNKIFPVQSGEEAQKILKENKIDVIISDILLKNENGIEFIRYIKKELGLAIPTILTTAHTDTEHLLDAIKVKVDDYLVKPINVKELLNSLHDVLLPSIQNQEINRTYNIIKTISAVTDSKQVELIRFIINNLDKDSILNYSYSEIMERVDISKPTIIKLFKQLSDQNILIKVQNAKYRFIQSNLPFPEKP